MSFILKKNQSLERFRMAEVNFLSSRIRAKAHEIIMEEGRPLSPSEIESLIRDQDEELWAEISHKCSDYIRIILSLSKEPRFVKYVSAVSLKGIDKRSLFFGCEDQSYPASQWECCRSKSKSANKKKAHHMKKKYAKEVVIPAQSVNHHKAQQTPLVIKESKAVQLAYPKVSSITLYPKEIDSDTAGNSWNNLSNKVPIGDPMWGQITSAIYEIGRHIQKNGSGSDLYRTLLPKYPILCNAKEHEQDIENILIREIMIREELQHTLYA